MKTPNDILKKIYVLTGFTSDDLARGFKLTGAAYSKNKQHGWLVGTQNKNYSRMSIDELADALDALIAIHDSEKST